LSFYFFWTGSKLANIISTIQNAVAGPSRLPPPITQSTVMPDPLPSTPERPSRQYQFVVHTPGDLGTPRNRQRLPPDSIEPSRNLRKNKQRASTILYTPRARRHQKEAANQSLLDSPTPTSYATRQPESPAGDSGSDEPEELFQRLNLGQSSAAAPAQARRFLPAALGPLHGRPGRKSPGKKSGNRYRKDIWKWTEDVEDRKVCIFCQYVKILA
jgi:hypothetical protein